MELSKESAVVIFGKQIDGISITSRPRWRSHSSPSILVDDCRQILQSPTTTLFAISWLYNSQHYSSRTSYFWPWPSLPCNLSVIWYLYLNSFTQTLSEKFSKRKLTKDFLEEFKKKIRVNFRSISLSNFQKSCF